MKYDQNFLGTCDMTLGSYFGNKNSTLGSVVPLEMFFMYSSKLFRIFVKIVTCIFQRCYRHLQKLLHVY